MMALVRESPPNEGMINERIFLQAGAIYERSCQLRRPGALQAGVPRSTGKNFRPDHKIVSQVMKPADEL